MIDELAVVFRAGDHVFAANVARIERLVLAEEIEPVTAADGARPPLVSWKGERYAGWDLAALLGYGASAASCLLLRLPLGPHWVSVALATGSCLLVQRIARLTAIPAGALVRRRSAVSGVFSTAGCGADLPPIGLYLELGNLLTAAELEASSAALSGAA